MTINYTAWRFWFDLLQLGGTCLIGVYVWWANSKKVTTARFSEHEKRLNTLEIDIKHPNCQHHLNFEGRLDALHGDIRELTGGVNGLRRAVDLMNEFLINQGGKK